MIRRVEHTLKFATVAKRQKLDSFFAEVDTCANVKLNFLFKETLA